MEKTECSNYLIWAKSDNLARDVIQLSSEITFLAFLVRLYIDFEVENELRIGEGKRLIAVPEPSPGGMQGSLALHGTGIRSPPPSNLTLPHSPYEFELRSPRAKRCGYTF
ncbi:hypothetical protein VNO78_13008 [Psophocarpus tetragonolobus]|uniref:Uncharacterized protein n=1 Tax=Psophocarpus tetragonolobus TaxID=3891 RepID=A0AAN9XPR8_PSOTE